MTYLTKRYHPPGTSPGTLDRKEVAEKVPLTLRIIDYAADSFFEKELASAEECQAHLKERANTWIHLQGYAEPDALRELGQSFGLHSLALEDIVNTGQRPKVDVYEDHLFVIASHPRATDGTLSSEQVSLFIGENYIISFHSGAVDPFEPVRQRLRKSAGKIRSRGPDYVFYTLLDMIIDEGFPVLEWFSEEIEDLEDELLERPSRATLRRLHEVKRELLLIRRTLWPQRDVLNVLIRDDSGLIGDEVKVYLRDCYDHSVQIMEILETYRDMATSMTDVYLSSLTYRLNDVMRVLTIIATIFIPLTFITSIYGMNFSVNENSPWAMPELRWDYGYPALWLVMIAVGIGMVVYFKRKHWF